MLTTKTLYEETIKSLVELNSQYRKELYQAVHSTGMCSGMPLPERMYVVRRLEEAIESNNKAIKMYEELNS